VQFGDPRDKDVQEAARQLGIKIRQAKLDAREKLRNLGVIDFQNQVKALQAKQVTSLASSI